MNCYNHFTIEERCCLREYYVKGKSYREIAKLLGRNVSSVSRELRRNCTFYRDVPRYYPYTAQKKSNLRNSYRHQGVFWDRKVLDYIEEKLSLTWSPEQIANSSCEFKLPSFKTIYRWLYEGYPKGRNLERVSEKTLKKNLALINARPKKVLHFQKPIDLFNEYLKKCCT